MKKDPKVFIGHIIESIELIEHCSEKLTTDTFKKNQALQDAIIWRFLVERMTALN